MEKRQITVKFALESLSKELREVAILYFIQGCKQKDIAKILGKYMGVAAPLFALLILPELWKNRSANS